jgi:hypothetical protein
VRLSGLRLERALLLVTIAALVAGLAAWFAGQAVVANRWWAAGTLAAVVPTVLWVVSALRHGRAGVDLLAVISLVGTLAVGSTSPAP